MRDRLCVVSKKQARPGIDLIILTHGTESKQISYRWIILVMFHMHQVIVDIVDFGDILIISQPGSFGVNNTGIMELSIVGIAYIMKIKVGKYGKYE